MIKYVRRLLTGAAIAIFLVVSLAWLTLRASLPELNGEFSASGLADVATIERDATGIPVITASSRADLAFAMGFAHGQDRFFQMDMIRRQAAGELSEVVGSATLGVDKRFRFHRFRARAEAVVAAASDTEMEILQRYADGVNAGVDSLGARPFEYFLLRAEPEPWRPEDSILAVYTMFAMLNDSRARKEVRRGYAHSVLPREVYAWMYPDGSKWDAPLMGESRVAAAIPSADVISLRDVADEPGATNETGRYRLRGSNNWAVSGAHTKHGRAIVSNDMHLGLDTPNVYYRARLVLDGGDPRDASGVTLPGTPFIIAGSNTRVAWGFTNSYGDYTDAVILRTGDEDGTYVTPDGDLTFAVHKEMIKVNGGESVELEIRETIWGPVLDGVEYPGGEIAVSWIAHKPEAINMNMLKLETVASVSEALDVANTMGMPPQNFVTGDAMGNIGWTIAGKIPLKTNFDAMLPADWSREQGWAGWLAADNYPRIVNPPSGRIWTANSRVTDGEALRIIGDGGYDLGARAKQIRDSLFAEDTFSPEDMLAIQYDDRALFLAPWRDLLLEILDDDLVGEDEVLIEYRVLLQNWIPRAAPESVGYRLVRAFRLEVRRRLFHALTAPVREAFGDDVELRISNQFESALWALLTERPMHMLPGDYDDWDGFLFSAIRTNIEYFTENYEGPLSQRNWGEINTAAIRHPLSGSIPFFGDALNMPADHLSGDTDMPKAQGPKMGASERFSVAPGDEANSVLHMPTGQSGHPLSDYYDAGHSDWVNGLPSPFLPGAAEHTLTLVPVRR